MDPQNKDHKENPLPESSKVSQLRDIFGFFLTTATVPVKMPVKVSQQIVLYVNGATKRLYVADLKNNTWHYINFTI